MTGRISIRDLAKIASVSRTTVSLALRDSSKISAPLRKRIQDLAALHNYRSHPTLTSLMQQIRTKRKIKDEEIIGFVTSAVTPEDWKGSWWPYEMWKGASMEANRLGFRLESFWAGYGAENSLNLSKMLYHRGIRGLLFAPMPWPHPVFNMPWNEFASVACTTSTGIRDLPIVRCDHMKGIYMTLSRLKELGAKSIGVIITEQDDLRLERAWSAGYQRFCLNERQHASHLLRLTRDNDIDAVAAFMKKVRPDVIAWHRNHVPQMLKTLGYNLGVELAHVCLDVELKCLGVEAGFFQDPSYLGQRAIRHISKSIYDQSWGLPEHPESIVVQGRFVEGKSLEPLLRATSPTATGALSQAVPAA